MEKAGEAERLGELEVSTEHPLDLLREALWTDGFDGCYVTHTSDLRWLTGWDYIFDTECAHGALVTRTTASIHTDSRYSGAMRARNDAKPAQGTNAASPHPHHCELDPQSHEQVLDCGSKAAMTNRLQEAQTPQAAYQPLWCISDERISHAAFVAHELTSLADSDPGQERYIALEEDLPLNRYRELVEACSKIGADDGSVADPGAGGSIGTNSTVRFVETPRHILTLRARKTPAEIAILRHSQQVTDDAFMKLLEWLRPGISEKEVAAELEYLMRRGGADGLAFPSIVASGPNSANPHAVPTARKLSYGDLVVIDFGARCEDYCSDTTRCLCVGVPTQRQRVIYNAVLAAHQAGKAAIRPGVSGAQVHESARMILEEYELAEYFIHSLGHGVGIAVHEQPRLAPKDETLLVEGNVVTVEPGVYIPDFGGVRIEDCGVVTKAGFESFTTLPHELIVIA